ncbi:MAG: hypothetical protein IH987_17985 [Planctomycetes bacterium]|nr:hypothetical protein [Planctomycetota bacterium]
MKRRSYMIGEEHGRCFHPYRVVDSNTDFEVMKSDVQWYKQQLTHCNDFSYYENFAAFLGDHPRLLVRPMKELYAPAPKDRAVVALRHDMDVDPWSALCMSQALRQAGITGTFYVLHTTEMYYGRFDDSGFGAFERYRGLHELLRSMQDDYHCEIGLHLDGLKFYLQYGMDGAGCVRAELAWLRSKGIKIVGTAAHNSAPVYGAENFEMLKGRAVLDRRNLIRNEVSIPLQTLDEAELGLTYEANYPEVGRTEYSFAIPRFLLGHPPDAVRNEKWMRTYLLENPYVCWGHDYNIWLIGDDRWVIAGHRARDPVFIWDAKFNDVCDFLGQLEPGKHAVCHIHPIYIWRPDENKALPPQDPPSQEKPKPLAA